MNSRQDYFSKLGKLLAEKHKVKIIVGGMHAKTDGKTVYLPNPDNFVGVDNRVIEGFIDHEIAHVHYTKKGSEAMAIAKDFQLLNAMEDVRVEHKMCQKFRGSKKYLEALEKFMDEKYPLSDPMHIKYRNVQRYMSGKVSRKKSDLGDAVCNALDKTKWKGMTTVRLADASNVIFDLLNPVPPKEEAPQEQPAPSSHGVEGEDKDAEGGVDAGGLGDDKANNGQQQNGSGDDSGQQEKVETQGQSNTPQEGQADTTQEQKIDSGNQDQTSVSAQQQQEKANPLSGAQQEDFDKVRNIMKAWVSLPDAQKQYAPITDFDTTTKAKYSPNFKNSQRTMSDGLLVAARLKGVFDAVGRKPQSDYKGKIDTKNLYKLTIPANDRPKVCISRNKSLVQDIALSIAVDASGSMDSGSTLRGLIPLCIGLEALGVKFSVFSFDAVKDATLSRMASKKSTAMPFANVRYVAVRLKELKNIDGNVSEEFIKWNYNAQGGTPTADAVIHGHKLLAKETAKHKMLLVFTDGKPTTSSSAAIAHLIKKQRDIVTIGVGLGWGVSKGSMREIFGDRQFCSAKYDVPISLFCTELRKVLERCI